MFKLQALEGVFSAELQRFLIESEKNTNRRSKSCNPVLSAQNGGEV